MRAAREAIERLVGIINTTLDGVGGVPGAQLILKGVARVTSGAKPPATAKIPNPVDVGTAAAKAAAKVAGAATSKPKPQA